MTISCRVALTYRQVTTIICKHAVRYTDGKLQRFIGLQPGNDNKLQHAVRKYIDSKLQRCIDLQEGNDNKLQCSEVQ